MELLRERDPSIPLMPACNSLGVSRATAYRHLRPPNEPAVAEGATDDEKRKKKESPRRLSDEERAEIVETMHSERFVDQTVRQAHAELLDEGQYIASVRTFYRPLPSQPYGHRLRRRHPRRDDDDSRSGLGCAVDRHLPGGHHGCRLPGPLSKDQGLTDSPTISRSAPHDSSS